MHGRCFGKLKAVACALYAPSRTEKELEALSEFGFSESDFGKTVEIWPENLAAVELFQFLGTQWRMGGMGGPCGLDYAVAYRKMDRMGLTTAAYDQLENDLQVLEYAALAEMNRKK